MIQSWENLVTDRGMDGQTDESDFIGCCWTNIKRPKEKTQQLLPDIYKQLNDINSNIKIKQINLH